MSGRVIKFPAPAAVSNRMGGRFYDAMKDLDDERRRVGLALIQDQLGVDFADTLAAALEAETPADKLRHLRDLEALW